MVIDKKYIYIIAMMTAFSTSLYLVEMVLPRPMPFMKIGLSNILLLVLVMSRLYKEALIVASAKSLIGAIMTGTLMTPIFALSFCGTILSCSMMIAFFHTVYTLSIFGVSVIGAFFHLSAQLVFVRLFMIQSDGVLSLFPFLAIFSIVTGLLTGFAGHLLGRYIDVRDYFMQGASDA